MKGYGKPGTKPAKKSKTYSAKKKKAKSKQPKKKATKSSSYGY